MSDDGHEPDEQWGNRMTGFNTTSNCVTNITTPTRFALEQAITAIRKEISTDPPFHLANETRRAEIDQLTDMIDRRR